MSTSDRIKAEGPIKMVLSEAPVTTLSNGLRVANFSSGHPFTFVDGTILAPCQADRVEALSLAREDIRKPMAGRSDVYDVQVKFCLTSTVVQALDDLHGEAVDVIICPLPVLVALRDAGYHLGKARTIIRANRETVGSPGLVKIDEFGT